MKRSWTLLLLLVVNACSNPPGNTDAADMDAVVGADRVEIPEASTSDMPTADRVSTAQMLVHRSQEREINPGQEVNNLCESWDLQNEETLYVNSVRFQATPGLHHSNWLFVPKSYFDGPDGQFNCSDRGYDQGLAGTVGGVLFAQTTQATDETQQFPMGTVVPIPPRSRVIAQVHLLNATASPVRSQYTLTVNTIAREQVRTRLSGLVLEYGPLRIPPRAHSQFYTNCAFAEEHQRALNRPLDFKVHYVLPHTHELGELFRISIIGGPNDGQALFEARNLVGEGAGRLLNPPVSLLGATGLRLTCGFNNNRDAVVRYGVGNQEMCIALAFVESERNWAGIAPHNQTSQDAGVVDATQQFTSPCSFVISGNSAGWGR